MTPLVAVAMAAACLMAHGLYAGAESALASANRAQLRLSAPTDPYAAAALHLIDAQGDLFATCLVGSTLFLVTGTAMVWTGLAERGVTASGLAVALYVPLAVILGEAVPRVVGNRHATTLAPVAAILVRVSRLAFAPLLPLVRAWDAGLQSITGTRGRTALTRQEILSLIREPAEAGALEIDPDEQRMIERVFAITTTLAEEVMTPLINVDLVAADSLVSSAIAVASRNGHTRLPVYEGRVDAIVGVIHARDLLLAPPDSPIRARIRPVRFVPEKRRVDDLLHDLRREREPFAVVVDEYGGSVGILTIEDLLEEIIGEIQDEREADHAVRRIGEGEWRVPAGTPVDQLARIAGGEIPKGDYETVGGLLLAVTGRIPRKGESFAVGDLTFRVEEANERAVQTVIVTTKLARADTGRERSDALAIAKTKARATKE